MIWIDDGSTEQTKFTGWRKKAEIWRIWCLFKNFVIFLPQFYSIVGNFCLLIIITLIHSFTSQYYIEFDWCMRLYKQNKKSGFFLLNSNSSLFCSIRLLSTHIFSMVNNNYTPFGNNNDSAQAFVNKSQKRKKSRQWQHQRLTKGRKKKNKCVRSKMRKNRIKKIKC